MSAKRETWRDLRMLALLTALLAASCLAFEAQLSEEAFDAPGPVFAPDLPSATARGDEAQKRLEKHLPALQALYRFAITEADAFRHHAWDRKKWFLPDPTDNRYAITLCKNERGVQSEWERILREAKAEIPRGKVRVFCHHVGKRIYLPSLDTKTILREMGRMLFPDDILIDGSGEEIADLFASFIRQRAKTGVVVLPGR